MGSAGKPGGVRGIGNGGAGPIAVNRGGRCKRVGGIVTFLKISDS